MKRTDPKVSPRNDEADEASRMQAEPGIQEVDPLADSASPAIDHSLHHHCGSSTPRPCPDIQPR
jgi:hypothetical protein